MTFHITNPMDMHLHLREGDMLNAILPFSANIFSAGVVMPNLKTPITTTQQALAYKANIESNSPKPFMPLVSIFLTPNLDKAELQKAKDAGIKILKLYPKGATTGSEGGVGDILCEKTLHIFELAQDLGFILSIHGESYGFCMEREYEFLEVFAFIAQHFPRLKVIIEHMSDRRSLEMIEKYENLYGTLTLHHITLCLDDVLGGALNPHLFCKPMLKTPKDRDALLQAALSAHPKISFGSDSAPHLESAKLSAKGAAGIFSAPVLLPKLVALFESHNALEHIQDFLSNRAITHYALSDFPKKDIILERKNFEVPSHIDTPLGRVIPLYAGEILPWRIKDIHL
ncbi:dihydroorotase [Helicobacter jaachi]|uniref:Dihydroorotase n=1 Tax=Helicobacter jaachi TaxID=1677920 RepID=A0A4U8TAG5_9HELI|nr:dihydroorotase [Helicobacter jaachi]TLD96866.1 dihydroorotase [Helicobacter jaachi]